MPTQVSQAPSALSPASTLDLSEANAPVATSTPAPTLARAQPPVHAYTFNAGMANIPIATASAAAHVSRANTPIATSMPVPTPARQAPSTPAPTSIFDANTVNTHIATSMPAPIPERYGSTSARTFLLPLPRPRYPLPHFYYPLFYLSCSLRIIIL
ncbi:hypothetical protein BDQ12DRAFT_738375 [Crucibulum laeve]|uniref:Uncharacterized protein n=1 Tax=Crucibulum laeve TaxID=68775 RepID=A0A5C3LNC0_9AGAR|nr:hypothetical protein BDQ12DRAFT_738375 [Crucibulum laeve]